MADEIDIRRPRKIGRILGAADQETEVLPEARRRHEQLFERALPVLGIGAEIGEIGSVMRLTGNWAVYVGVDVSIERSDVAGPELVAKLIKQPLSAGEAQHQCEPLETGCPDIGNRLAALQLRQGDRRIQIVENRNRTILAEH